MTEARRAHAVDDRCDPALLEILRGQTPAMRLATLDSLWRSAVALVRSGVKAQHPAWSDNEVATETARRMARRSDEGRR